ncbi:MAG: metal ABC transporter permease [Erysipelothrix sp.]|nr:metal ABC transporter permease [Erysipelothrix sp.]
MFQYAFMIRALIAGVSIALSASLIGVNLVLSRNSLLGDGLSHVAFGSMAISLVLGQEPLLFSMIVAMIAAYFILKISRSTQVSGDAMIGVISSSALAVGVVVTQVWGVNADISSYMFGSILGVNQRDMWVAVLLGTIVLIGFILMYNRIFSLTFDESFAKAVGQKTERFHSILAILTAIVVVLGMRLMGALLISGLIIFPTMSASRLFKSFKLVTISAGIMGVMNYIIGLILAANFNLPTGASVILVNLFVLIFAWIINLFKNH